MKIDDIKNFIQSANINFLFGAGLSSPYLSTLSKIEDHLTDLSNKRESQISSTTVYSSK